MDATETPGMDEAEFCRRFVTEMVRQVGETDANGESVREYAQDVAPSYYADASQRADGPEECAASDLDNWEWADV